MCDHVILLSVSRVQICEDIEALLDSHRMLVGPWCALSEVEPGLTVVTATQTQRQTRLLVRRDAPVLDPRLEEHEVGLEDIILGYMGSDPGTFEDRLVRLEVAPCQPPRLAASPQPGLVRRGGAGRGAALILLVTGITMADDYRRALAGCTATQSCFDLSNQLFRGDGAIIDLVDLTLVIPLLFGLFWGHPSWPRSSRTVPTTWPGPRGSAGAAGCGST